MASVIITIYKGKDFFIVYEWVLKQFINTSQIQLHTHFKWKHNA